MYKVIIPHRLQRRIRRLPGDVLIRLKRIISEISKNPFMGKKLKGRYQDKYSVRLWPYRIIYKIQKEELIVEVIEIEHRGRAYRK